MQYDAIQYDSWYNIDVCIIDTVSTCKTKKIMHVTSDYACDRLWEELLKFLIKLNILQSCFLNTQYRKGTGKNATSANISL